MRAGRTSARRVAALVAAAALTTGLAASTLSTTAGAASPAARSAAPARSSAPARSARPTALSAGPASSSGLETGWIYDGSIKDQGYDEEWYDGQLYLEKTLHIQAQIVQNEPYTSQWTSTDLSMAANGAKILYDPGDGGSLFYAACAKLPKVACIESNGVKPFPSNVDSVYPENWLASYLEGMAAGEVSKKGVIGFLAAYPNTPAPVIETLNALVLGCQATHPGCKAIVDVVNSWYNPPVENEDLNALVDAGADILASTNNDPAAIEVAEKRGVWGIGSWANGASSGPKAFITSQVINWAPSLLQLTKQVIDGSYHGGKIIVFGFGPGLQLAPWGENVPSAVRKKVDAAEASMQHGKNYFCGPIYDNSNKLRVASGTCMSTMQLYDQWTWYVRGVSISK